MAASRDFDVLVVGAGPAGLAAACCAAESGRRAGLVDDNPDVGGQIWRSVRKRASLDAAAWIERLEQAPIEIICGASVFDHPEQGRLLADRNGELIELGYQRLVVATGARELFLPFPGWTLPGVMGAGGLQALVKGGLPIASKKVIVAGSGPLLLAVAAFLHRHWAHVRLIAEQAPRLAMLRFGCSLAISHRPKLREALELRREMKSVPYRPSCWPVAAEGNGKLSAVVMTNGRRTWRLGCDYLACGFGLTPNVELAALLGCELAQGAVVVDDLQRTNVEDVFCAGEPTGIGGLELALLEGQIAGYAAADEIVLAQPLFAARTAAQRFAKSLAKTFAPRPALRRLPRPDTLVCRCEDVPYSALVDQPDGRAAKLQTRCGMGACQGRICGAATNFLFGWNELSVRPPIVPVALSHLGPQSSSDD